MHECADLFLLLFISVGTIMAKVSKDGRTSLLFLLAAFVLAAAVTFFMLMPRKESFIDLPSASSYSLYQKPAVKTPAEFDRAMQMYGITLEDANELMQMKRCWQLPDVTIDKLKADRDNLFTHPVEKGMYFVDFDMVTCSFDDVQSRIICELQKFHEEKLCNTRKPLSCTSFPKSKTDVGSWNTSQKCGEIANNQPQSVIEVTCSTKIQGPVYVMLTQAPYYRNNNNEMMHAQFTMDMFGRLPYNANRTKPDDDAPIYYYVMILFSRYNRDGRLSSIDYMRDTYFNIFDSAFFSKEKQCFIMTKNNSKHVFLPGGCGSLNNPYRSSCIGPSDPNNPSRKEKDTESTFAIIFQINTEYPLIVDIMGTGKGAVKLSDAPGCGRFDEVKYKETYPDITRMSKTPINHWATEGIQEGRLGFIQGVSFGGTWNPSGYKNIHNDVKSSDIDALQHFSSVGWKENRAVCLGSAI
jgi:hypothetical protein